MKLEVVNVHTVLPQTPSSLLFHIFQNSKFKNWRKNEYVQCPWNTMFFFCKNAHFSLRFQNIRYSFFNSDWVLRIEPNFSKSNQTMAWFVKLCMDIGQLVTHQMIVNAVCGDREQSEQFEWSEWNSRVKYIDS